MELENLSKKELIEKINNLELIADTYRSLSGIHEDQNEIELCLLAGYTIELDKEKIKQYAKENNKSYKDVLNALYDDATGGLNDAINGYIMEADILDYSEMPAIEFIKEY